MLTNPRGALWAPRSGVGPVLWVVVMAGWFGSCGEDAAPPNESATAEAPAARPDAAQPSASASGRRLPTAGQTGSAPRADGPPGPACEVVDTVRLEPRTEMPPVEFRTGGVVWVGPDRLALSDTDDMQVIVFDLEGTERLRFGGRGGGPGEFRAIGPVAYRPGAGFLVAGAMRITRFDSLGGFIGTAVPPAVVMNLLSWDGDEAVVSWVAPFAGPTIGAVRVERGEIEPLFSPFERDSTLPAEIMDGIRNDFVPLAGDGAGRIVVTEPNSYRLVTFDRDGQVVGESGRSGLRRQTRSQEERQRVSRVLERTIREFDEDVRAIAAKTNKRLLDAPKPHFTNRLRFDDTGRLWIPTTRTVPDSTEIDIFRSNGVYWTSIRVRHHVIDLAFLEDRVAVLHETLGGPFDGQHAVATFRLTAGGCRGETPGPGGS